MFLCRSTVLTFVPGQLYHRVVVEIIDDSTPELDEQFSVQLLEPMGGAVLGTQSSLTVTILTNDNAYGLVGFANVSRTVSHTRVTMYIMYVTTSHKHILHL